MRDEHQTSERGHDDSTDKEEHPFYDGLENCIPYTYKLDKGESTTAMTILHDNPDVKAQEVDFTKNPAEITVYVYVPPRYR